MKIHHYAILFVILALAYVTVRDIATSEVIVLRQEEMSLNYAFNQAVDSAAQYLVEDETRSVAAYKEKVVETFFLSMYASLGVALDNDKQEELKRFVPFFVLVDTDGLYINYCETLKGADGYQSTKRVWSERIPYRYETEEYCVLFTLGDVLSVTERSKDEVVIGKNNVRNPFKVTEEEDDFEAIKRMVITETIETTMEEVLVKHNELATSFGITYQFTLPPMDNSMWNRAVEVPGLLVFFQGYPYVGGEGRVYNRSSFHAAVNDRKEKYYLIAKDWHYLYHRENCEELAGLNLIEEEAGDLEELIVCFTEKECAEHGAYPCQTCINTVEP